MEAALVPERPEVELERLAFYDPVAGDVAYFDIGEVRLARRGAQACKFVRGEFDDIVSSLAFVGESFELPLGLRLFLEVCAEQTQPLEVFFIGLFHL